MSNRFTKYTADKLRADGWLDKEQADALRTRLQQVESERDNLLERLQEADYLVRNAGTPDHSFNYEQSKDWFSRRDAFLNPKPQDVM